MLSFDRTGYRLFKGIIKYDTKLDSSQQYMFASHPHGVLSAHHGMLVTGMSDPPFHKKFPGDRRRHLGASIVFKIPLYREFLLWCGVVDAGKETANMVLRSGKSIYIVLGGIAEQMLSQRGNHSIFIRNRKGFIKLALEYGVHIVPAYAFGETDIYSTSTVLLRFRQNLSRKLGIALPFAFGPNPILPFMPYKDSQLAVVFGSPIAIPRIKKPTAVDVDNIHLKYVEEVTKIFEKYKDELGHGSKTIQIF